MLGLYPIVDLDSLEHAQLPVLAFAAEVLRAKPKMLQLRAKNAPASELLPLLGALQRLCAAAGTDLIVNDRVDLALLCGAAGVHVGQDDIPISDVRRLAPDLKVGVSTHTLSQLSLALASGPTYVAFGPIFQTTSKANADPPLGLAGVRAARTLTHAVACPLVVIGGLTAEHLAELGALGVGAALIRALLPADGRLESVSAHVNELTRQLGGALPAV